MAGPARRRLSHLFKGVHIPRRTVRLRLTLLYGGLFLASSAVLLAITYVVVRNLTGGSYVRISNRGLTIAGVEVAGGPPPGTPGAAAFVRGSGQVTHVAAGSGAGPLTRTPKELAAQARELQRVAVLYHDSELHHLLVTYGVALGVMAVVSVGLGWLVAGRILRPLRTITATTRAIGVTDLHQRLALSGPDDELQELGDTVDELLERLETSFASQKQFVANASHELRTPLARQRTLGQVALSDPDASVESLRDAHERILASGEEQEQLIDALLTLSRVQGGAVEEQALRARIVGGRASPGTRARGDGPRRAHPEGLGASPPAGRPAPDRTPGGEPDRQRPTTQRHRRRRHSQDRNTSGVALSLDHERRASRTDRGYRATVRAVRAAGWTAPEQRCRVRAGVMHRQGRCFGAWRHPGHPGTPNRWTSGGGSLPTHRSGELTGPMRRRS